MHVIQAFLSEDESEEVQIQGRTARQGKKGTYSLILAESEIAHLGLSPGELARMQAKNCYAELCRIREDKQGVRSQKMERILAEADSLDQKSHSYFDALLGANCPLARDRLQELCMRLGQSGGAYHFVCCYDESGSMENQPWQDLQKAHRTCMQSLQQIQSIKVSVVQFSGSCRTVLELADVQQAAVARLNFKGGGTSFEPALAEAFRLMRAGQRQYPGLRPVLLFMTDGCNGDGDCISTITKMHRDFPALLFHAVIFGQTDSERLRGMVGAVPNGKFHVSIDGVKLVETFSAIASSLEYTGRG